MSELTIYALDAQSAVPHTHWDFAIADTIQVGRHPENDLVLNDRHVSRFHATLFHDGRDWHCAAFGANGILVGGVLVSHAVIRNGLTIQFAGSNGSRLLFETDTTDDEEQIRGSMTFLIGELQNGSHESLEEIWARCFATVIRLARQRLGASSRRVTDEEDIAVGVFHSLFDASSSGRLPELNDRESLWRLLITMTSNRAKNVLRDQHRQKRGSGQVRGDSIGDLTELGIPAAGPSAFDNLMGHTPTPDAIVAINEQIQDWLTRLPDDEHREVALRRMEGYANGEIAEELSLPLRTVERRLSHVRSMWSS